MPTNDVRIARLETKLNGAEQKISDYSSIAEAVTKLTLLSEQQNERNKKSDELYEKVIISNAEFNTTLKTIDENLSFVNKELKDSNNRISNLEDKICNLGNKSKLDILDITKDWIPKLIAGGAIFYLAQLVKTII